MSNFGKIVYEGTPQERYNQLIKDSFHLLINNTISFKDENKYLTIDMYKNILTKYSNTVKDISKQLGKSKDGKVIDFLMKYPILGIPLYLEAIYNTNLGEKYFLKEFSFTPFYGTDNKEKVIQIYIDYILNEDQIIDDFEGDYLSFNYDFSGEKTLKEFIKEFGPNYSDPDRADEFFTMIHSISRKTNAFILLLALFYGGVLSEYGFYSIVDFQNLVIPKLSGRIDSISLYRVHHNTNFNFLIGN